MKRDSTSDRRRAGRRWVATWVAGWLMAAFGGRAADNGAWAEALVAERDARRGGSPVTENAWFTTGPLPVSGFADVRFPERGVDLAAKEGGKRLWRSATLKDGVVNPLGAGDRTATYLYRELVAQEPGTLRIGLGSDDGIEFWFNGEKRLSQDVPRGAAPNQDLVEVRLRAGTNTALVKVFNRSGDSGFFYDSGHSSAAALAALGAKFPAEMRLFTRHVDPAAWFRSAGSTELERSAAARLLARLQATPAEQARFDEVTRAGSGADSRPWLGMLLALAREVEALEQAGARLEALPVAPVRAAVQDLIATYGERYAGGPDYLRAIDQFERDLPALRQALARGDRSAVGGLDRFEAVRRRALLANPILDFERVLLVRRSESNLGLPQNWQGNSSVNAATDNEIATLGLREADPSLRTVYRPAKNWFVGDVDLHFDADRMLFSSIGTHQRWQIFEVGVDGTGLRQVTKGDERDVDNYDPVYLPDGRIIFDSTSTFQGVPCVGGGDYVANLHLMNPDGTGIRRLCFDQDNDWCPTMLPNGRVLYLRWEYTDSAHYFSRVLMSMNPDGTGQGEYYGSNSYWPNSLFYARPLPGSTTRFVGIVTGHHGVPRMGEMIVFDTTRGRQEASGAIRRIGTGSQPVPGVIRDTLVDESWPKFLHPYPLSDKYFLAACKPSPQARWGVYLVDAFDNLLLLKEEPGFALLEPLPLRPSPRPPVLQDRVNLARKDATAFIQDIYAGNGLEGVPRGTVKTLRVFQYEYSYRNQGGHYFVGMEGGWDVRRMIGTVPVYADGSAFFRIPANTPVAVQPLDAEGKALQLMRSWFVGMPGEGVSCVGCHERQNASASPRLAEASRQTPSEPAPWYGPKRGFGFVREVQPVLDRYCVGCHQGEAGRPNLADSRIVPTSGGISPLPRSYLELHPYVRRNGPEGDYHTLTPLEFHADTSLLVQMLRKGHYQVRMDREAWDRLITWIDINVPAYGTYHEVSAIPSDFERRRYECKQKYAGVEEDIEAIPEVARPPVTYLPPPPMPTKPARPAVPGWPMAFAEAKSLQAAAGGTTNLTVSLGQGMNLTLRRIPAGRYAMGDVDGDANEFPMGIVEVAEPFWIGATEISLEQYQRFDPNHRNGYYDMHYKDQVKPGYLMDASKLPVIRVSWNQAMAFCQWLSALTGRAVTLPTEAQWEWACRAGTDSPAFYGNLDADFSKHANLADASISRLAVSGVDPQPISNPDRFWDFVPKDARFNDGVLHLAECGHYQPNAWGLQDMIGNVAEWTLDDYRPYPYVAAEGRGEASAGTRKVVRGGSWAERPRESRAASRLDYPAWQRVYNVGFRVVLLDRPAGTRTAAR